MAEITLAIDPGTHRAGVAVFKGETLTWAAPIEPPRGLEVEERIDHIIRALAMIAAAQEGPVAVVALEQATAIEGHQPAPELQTLIRRIRRWARRKPIRAQCRIYHPSTIHAAIRFRQHSGPRKEQIKLGVLALYSRQLPNDPPEDVVDAVAIGHCHLAKLKEAEIQSRKV